MSDEPRAKRLLLRVGRDAGKLSQDDKDRIKDLLKEDPAKTAEWKALIKRQDAEQAAWLKKTGGTLAQFHDSPAYEEQVAERRAFNRKWGKLS
jgi:hypothetical protein